MGSAMSATKTTTSGNAACPPDTFMKWAPLKTSGCGPSPRSGHDVTVIGSKAYLFGGCGGKHESKITCLNDVYAFDLELHRWDRVELNGDGGDLPAARASFGMCAGPNPNSIVVAGGTGVEMESLRADVMEFNTKSRTWSKVLTDSEATPCKFYGQSVCTYGDSLLLFGGSTGLHYTNDLYQYNVRTGHWAKLVTTGRKPSPRYKHQALIVDHKMYVLGGGCFKPEQSTIDLYCLDLHTLCWQDSVQCSGEMPKSRVAHSCSYDPEGGTIYLWGGFTSELSRLQDFYAFDCATGVWTDMNKATAAAAVAAAAATTATATIAGGGTEAQQLPAPASGGSAALPVPELQVPPARAFHSAVFYKGSLYVFSGANGDVRYSDVWRYQVRTSVPTLSMLAAHAVVAAKNSSSSSSEDCSLNSRIAALTGALPEEVAAGLQHFNTYAEKLC